MPDELVRVRLNGVEKNMGRSLAESSEGVEILDEPTSHGDRRLRASTSPGGRPRKPKTTVAKKAAEKQAAVTPAPTTKEQS